VLVTCILIFFILFFSYRYLYINLIGTLKLPMAIGMVAV